MAVGGGFAGDRLNTQCSWTASVPLRGDWSCTVSDRGDGSGLRLAELVAAMSLASDLGLGQPMEHLLRSCRLGLRLADTAGLSEEERAVVYYVALLGWVGCHAESHEQAAWFGDEIAMKADRYEVDMVGRAGMSFVLRHVGAGGSPLRRARMLPPLVASHGRVAGAFEGTHCQLAGQVALGLGLGVDVQDALEHVFERWDGKGRPAGLQGEEVALAARIVQLAGVVERHRREGGIDAAVQVARRRRGTQFDPALVDQLCLEPERMLASLETATSWDELIDAEPALRPVMSEEQLEQALEAIADLADLKSPYTTGHSRGVAELVSGAADRCGFSIERADELRTAARMHDLGRLGVSSAIWDKPGPLSDAEFERVRMFPYFTQRMFSRSARLAPPAEIAAQHLERLDGSGYPRGSSGAALSPAVRLLAVADAYQALLEPRAHRAARSSTDAANVLAAEVKAGRLDGDAVQAVLAAAGHRVARRREWPAGLTAREVEVLVLAAQGLSNKDIADRLVISPKTVGNHIQHIYIKVGCSSRAEASLFAMRHGLLGELRAAQR
jgi:HD-GYP domain-containing protein (c-di-GMP phosphodiesterase class II)